MFESVEQGNKIDKDQYEAEVPRLRVDLLNAQFDLREAEFAVLIMLVGDDRQGCEEIVDLLQEWMDGRYIETHFFGEPSDEERERPRFWRYWRALPPKGSIGLHFGAWMLKAISDRVTGRTDDDTFEKSISHIRAFQQCLADDGMVVLKLWLHLPRKELKKRLKRAKKDPEKSWQVEEADWRIYENYNEAVPAVEQLLLRTTTDSSPLHLIEGTDSRYRNLTVGRIILNAIRQRLDAGGESALATETGPTPAAAETDVRREVLASVDLSASLKKDAYKTSLDEYQARLSRLSRRAREAGQSSVLVFEGWDAAGKGGVIRRITSAMSARDCRVIPIAAPTDEERAHHYLWRFWRHLPRAGKMIIFDRSWYGRVLVERVEQFAREEEWRRAYGEIADFEEQLVDHGMVVLKFWLHIDAEEQLRRFRAREQTPYKKHKITGEDYRNRERWDDYVIAIGEMVAHTHRDSAPWHLIAANDKRSARVTVLKTVCKALDKALDKALAAD